MEETVESIKKYGVLVPGIVRPRTEGGYEILSGHRRKHASELAGKDTMPVIIKDVSDDESVIIMVDANIQREDILPSEKAKAYSMKYEAMKHQGTSGGLSLEEMGKQTGDAIKTIQRYISIRNKVKEGIADTNRTIAKIDSFGKGMREAGQKVANTFRTFADKEEVDYSDKEKKFSKTEVVKKPWQWQKKVYESMVLHLDAAIDKVEDLSRDVELDRMEKKQIDKPEQVTDIRDAIAPVSSVAEPTEYQFGAEAFEAAYPKMDSVIKPDEKAPSVPKTGKVR